jgi:peroxiredoxin
MEQTNTPFDIFAPDFELPGVDDSVHHLATYLENYQAVGVVFLSNNCPYVRSYIDRLKQIQTDFEGQGFILIGINANHPKQVMQESLEQMKIFAAEHQLNFPYLRDTTQDVLGCFNSQVTPEVFLLDKSGSICYRGRIDDSVESPDSVQNPYLRNSILALLNREKVVPNSTEAVGSPIEWRK